MVKPQRPVAVLVIAIFHFIIGAVKVLGNLCIGGVFVGLFALMSAVMNDVRSKDPQAGRMLDDFFKEILNIPGIIPVLATVYICQFLLGVVLIVAGFGLLNMKGWARWASIFFAVVCLFLVAGEGVYNIAVVNPRMQKLSNEFQQKMESHARAKGQRVQPQQNPFQNNAIANLGGSVVGSVFHSIYPIAVLIVMFLPNVSQAFAARQRPSDYRDRQAAQEDDLGEYERRYDDQTY
jgi:hypothetical protein